MAFVHLHNHSQYSLLDGATDVGKMAKRANELEMPAVALTDHGYMYGIPVFDEACRKAGVKPILGCEVYFTPDNELRRDRKPEIYHLILLAKDVQGYQNLVKLVSRAAVDGFYYKPRVTFDSLREYAAGLICSSACVMGIVPQKLIAQQRAEAARWAADFAEIFAPGDFYIELQNQGIVFTPDELNRSIDLKESEVKLTSSVSQVQLNGQLSELASELGLKTVAANDLHYLLRSDAPTQDIMLCIGTASRFDDPNRMRFCNDQFYMKTEAEMRQAMAGFEEACDNTLEIAEKCGNNLISHAPVLPSVPLPPGETNESALRREAQAGLERLYGNPLPQEVKDLMEHEYSIICDTGFAGYFLVVQEFTKWAREHGIGVGPGRGSAAGSIVAYGLGITGLDPIANQLIFERFLTRERPEMPDIDIDFDEEGRFEVIEHLRQLYGERSIAHVINFNSLKAKQAIVDATRVFDYPIALGARISKMIPFDPKASLAAALERHSNEDENKRQRNPDLVRAYADEADTKRILDAALTLEGAIRGEGVHASAVIICPDDVDNHVPMKYDTKGGMLITQYDGSSNAELGLLKMDILGLRTLNVLMKARQYVKDNHGQDIDPETLPLSDKKVMDMLAKGDTAGVFQVESPGMTALIRSMNVSSYDDIVAAIAIYRPGPLNAGMTRDFVDCKVGKKPVTYYDQRLKPILESTYGTIVYQEQVMRISMLMSGFTAGESDLMRKAIGKKNIALMKEKESDWSDGSHETMQQHWLNGAERNGYDRKLAQKIWDDVERFAEYAFNKSHSAAYAILVVRTAWFKAYYPKEYMAAVLSSYVGRSERLAQYITACKQGNIAILSPDVNSSGREFTALPEGIRFGLAGIKGVGEAAADAIIAERQRGGIFTSLHDFIGRINNTLANKKTVDALVKSGAFDSTDYTRRQMMRFIEVDKCMETAARIHRERAEGQISLFAEADSSGSADFADLLPAPDNIEWDMRTLLAFEKEVLGMYVSGHPLDPYQQLLEENRDYPLSVFSQQAAGVADAEAGEEGVAEGDAAAALGTEYKSIPQGTLITLAGMLTKVSLMVSRKGERMAKFTLEDMDGSIDAIVFPTYFREIGGLLEDERVLSLRGRYESTDRGAQFLVNSALPLSLGRGGDAPMMLELHLRSEAFNQKVSDELARLMRSYPGRDASVLLISHVDGAKTRIQLPLTVDARSEELRIGLAVICGDDAVVCD
ncbi:MAG: DNA polymerase III subunit alpha [Actinomycetia bacterium]|nr:DNA polymerase III subunit alpha [Actinomycetes bacterium]